MNYPEEMCTPMRADLTSAGFVELKTPEAVSDLLDKKEGTVLVMVIQYVVVRQETLGQP